MWVKEHSISTEDWEFHGAEDYNESDDKYYWPEGWYEWNEMEEVHWMCKDVLFWTELPIYDKSELKTRIKPVDTKTVDAVEFAEWLKVNNHELKLDSDIDQMSITLNSLTYTNKTSNLKDRRNETKSIKHLGLRAFILITRIKSKK